MHSLNIVQLIERNNMYYKYDSKILNKIRDNFTEQQQQLFLANAYCSIKHDTKNEFIIDFENVWRWLGFQKKDQAKTILTKNFVADVDYVSKGFAKKEDIDKKESEDPDGKKDYTGCYNKERIFLNINAFKKFCLRSGPKRDHELQDYYIKIEELLQQAIHWESCELKLQLCKSQTDRDKVCEEYKGIPIKRHVEQDKDKNVIFLLSTVDGRYMVDKVHSLSEQRRIFHRAKIVDYKIPYHISCKNLQMMEIIESSILMKLDKYKSKITPDIFLTNNIDVFINIFDECLKFYEDVEVAIYPSRD